MANLEERVNAANRDIDALHDTISRTNWRGLTRESFVFQLEVNVKKLKTLNLALHEINRETKMLLEKNTPSLDDVLEEFPKTMAVLEANLALEKKTKQRDVQFNMSDKTDVPELYSSLQQKMLALILRAKYSVGKISTFLDARKTPFVKKGTTAKTLIELLQRKDDELTELKQKHVDLKKKSFMGFVQEKSLAEMEHEIHEMDKKLNSSVEDVQEALKTHAAQLNYVEGSLGNLKQKVSGIEMAHSGFAKKALELIKELKQERDYAKTSAIDIEQETLKLRGDYTKRLLNMEEEKHSVEEKARQRYEREISSLKKELEEKGAALKNLNKLAEEQEKEIKRLKK